MAKPAKAPAKRGRKPKAAAAPRKPGSPQRSPVALANLQEAHQPTEVLRQQVATMAGYGLTQAQIALLIEVSEPTLRKYYERELKLGEARATLTVSQTLYRRATSGNDLGAAIFWMKARGGWRERDAPGGVTVNATAQAAAGAGGGGLALTEDRRRAVMAIVRARALAEADHVGVGAAD